MLNFSSQKNENYSIETNSEGNNTQKDNRFSSKNNGATENPAANEENVNVYAMPGKFLASSQAKIPSQDSSGSGRKILIFGGVFLVLATAIGAGAYWYFNLPKVPEAENTNQVAINQNTNTNVNQNQNSNQNLNTNVNQNQNSNQNLNTNVNQNINTNEAPIVPLVESPDLDNDLLTYEEERVFGTDSNSDDTDRDGYKDGSEIINLYNPLVPAQLLVDSSLVTKFINSTFYYSILLPSSWIAQSVADDVGNIMILPDSETGELFTVYAMANDNNWNLNQARENLADILGYGAVMQNYNLAGKPALRSIDQKKVLMLTDKYIYMLVYDTGSLSNGNFKTTFQMMLNSFELLPNE